MTAPPSRRGQGTPPPSLIGFSEKPGRRTLLNLPVGLQPSTAEARLLDTPIDSWHKTKNRLAKGGDDAK